MKQEVTIPFTWNSWDMVDTCFNTYYDVTFTSNFGSFTKGNKFNSISVDYGNGIIEAYNEDGTEVIIMQKFVAVPN